MYSEQRVAQMAAYLLKLRGGRMSYLKLMKLLYLAERESLRLYGVMISDDRLVSMPRGPVLSRTYSIMMDGSQQPEGWDYWIQDESRHEVVLVKASFDRDTLDELSDSHLEILDAVFSQFGQLSRWELVEYTHQHCPEWQDPDGSSNPIQLEQVFLALGKTQQESELLVSRYKTLQELDHTTRQL
jgi:uncharacterized phage-associated protein